MEKKDQILTVIITFLVSYFFASAFNIHFKIQLLLSFLIAFVAALLCLSRFLKSPTAMLPLIFFFPLLPFHLGYDFNLPVPVLRIHRLLMIIMLFYWGFKSRTIKTSIKKLPFTRIVMVLIIIMTMSSLFSRNIISSLFYTGTMFFEVFLFLLMFYDLVNTEKEIRKLLKLIVFSSLIASLIGFFEFKSGFNIYTLIKPFRETMEYAITQQIREGGFRIRGAFDHAISFGMFLVLSLNALMILFFDEKKKSRKIGYVIMFTIIAIAVILTKSRMAIFLLLFNIIAVLFLLRRFHLAFILCFSVMALASFPLSFGGTNNVFFLIKGFVLPFDSGSSEMLSSTQSRVALFYDLLNMIKQNPIVGYGKINLIARPLDNFYLSFAYSFGIIALCLFLFIMLKTIMLSMGYLFSQKDPRNRLIIACFLGALLSFLISLTVVSLSSYWYVMLIYLGILFKLIRMTPDSENGSMLKLVETQ